MHTQTWRCMQTAYKFDVEQTKPSVSHCFTEMNFRTNWEPLVFWLNKNTENHCRANLSSGIICSIQKAALKQTKSDEISCSVEPTNCWEKSFYF